MHNCILFKLKIKLKSPLTNLFIFYIRINAFNKKNIYITYLILLYYYIFRTAQYRRHHWGPVHPGNPPRVRGHTEGRGVHGTVVP